ncbi:N,O-diacetylmuramidase [Bimuria novae-zelandiae CBS 107.79]|uniref:N,O-diacetylmuramidase n=1 Tax=Bimuria novae-zelandiae CBS 107.79 TaxID=1447943 RepID=A0A6A5VCZ9_9PLEO|nr:N,O-diacetylmuramidase [Bimuria novae-zelandiae CBS 107.79]
MKFLTHLPFLSTLTARAPRLTPRTVQGLDISHYQNNPNLAEAHTVGLAVYIKATEGPTYIDPKFSSHYQDATNASFLRGGYHVARLDLSPGPTQAQFFLANGGGWAADGKTLPGLLSVGIDGGCGDMSVDETRAWIRGFVEEYEGATTRSPVIGTRNEWWVECTGNTREFSEKSALMLANAGESVGMIPGRWQFATIWQYKEGGAWGGNSNIFSGDAEALRKLIDG